MRGFITICTTLLFPLLAFSQATTTTAAATSATILPTTLPACAAQCGALYDAQGSCTPPGLPVSNTATYDSCFCAYSTLQPFNQGTSGVCDNACTSDPSGLTDIRNWFLTFCGKAVATPTNTATTATGAQTQITVTSTSKPQASTGHKSWISTHYQWVIMLVVLFFAITLGWVLACVLRRRYLRKKEREIELRGPVAWGPHQSQSTPYGDGVVDAETGRGGRKGKGVKTTVEPAQDEKYGTEPAKKKWIVKERT